GVDHPAADQVADLIGGEIRTGEHRQDTGHRRRCLGIDAHDARMRMRRAQETGMRLPRTADVIGVAAPAGDETLVFFTADRRPDAGTGHGVSSSPPLGNRIVTRCPPTPPPAACCRPVPWPWPRPRSP